MGNKFVTPSKKKKMRGRDEAFESADVFQWEGLEANKTREGYLLGPAWTFQLLRLPTLSGNFESN